MSKTTITAGFYIIYGMVCVYPTDKDAYLVATMVAQPGVEPGSRGHEPRMLPLHYSAILIISFSLSVNIIS